MAFNLQSQLETYSEVISLPLECWTSPVLQIEVFKPVVPALNAEVTWTILYRSQSNLTLSVIRKEFRERWRDLLRLGLRMVQSVSSFYIPVPRFKPKVQSTNPICYLMLLYSEVKISSTTLVIGKELRERWRAFTRLGLEMTLPFYITIFPV